MIRYKMNLMYIFDLQNKYLNNVSVHFPKLSEEKPFTLNCYRKDKVRC